MTRFMFSQGKADGSTSLYATDGTAAGTTDLNVSRFDFAVGREFVEFKCKTAFLGNGDSPFPYICVYATDGTAAGTTGTLVASGGGPLIPRGLWAVGDRLLASGPSQDAPAALHASSDGVRFTEIERGVGTDALDVSHGIGYFAADLNNSGTNGLWRTDGTAAGSCSITPAGVALAPADITSVGNGKTLFVDGSDGATSLWATDGTAAGTYRLNDAALGNSINIEDGSATANSHAIFTAVGRDSTISVWSSDGTSAGTYEVLVNGPADAPVRYPSGYVTWGSKVLFSTGYGVAVTDGTKPGTVSLSSGEPDFFAGVGRRVFIASGEVTSTLPCSPATAPPAAHCRSRSTAWPPLPAISPRSTGRWYLPAWMFPARRPCSARTAPLPARRRCRFPRASSSIRTICRSSAPCRKLQPRRL